MGWRSAQESTTNSSLWMKIPSARSRAQMVLVLAETDSVPKL